MKSELDQLLSETEDSLILRLGKLTQEYHETKDLGIRPPSRKQIYDWGKTKMNNLIGFVREKICNNEKLKKIRQTKTIDNIEYAVLLIELIEKEIGQLYSPLIAVLLIQKGMNNICDDK